jgi:PDZ domain
MKITPLLLLLIAVTGTAYAASLNGQVESNNNITILSAPQTIESQLLQMPKWINGEPPIAPPRQLRISRVALSGQVQGIGSNNVPLQAKTALRVELPPVNHGQSPVGVVGMENTMPMFTRNIKIRTVFPGSDLNTYAIHPGDIILAINGIHPNSLREMRDLTRGQPGTTFNLTVVHNGAIETVPIVRKDSRMFVQYDHYDGYFKWAAAQTRYW